MGILFHPLLKYFLYVGFTHFPRQSPLQYPPPEGGGTRFCYLPGEVEERDMSCPVFDDWNWEEEVAKMPTWQKNNLHSTIIYLLYHYHVFVKVYEWNTRKE